ncbi:MAG: PASTA domain-containing protein [Candidatus Latescibacterota bacterium]|jgi:beta-lactam-binding protein with PASTA domain
MKKFFTKVLLLGACAGSAAILILVLIDGFVMPYIVDVPNIKIPRLHDLSAAKAAERLEQWGLKMAIGDSLYHKSIARGDVIDQTPQAGQRVKRGRRITLTLSKGSRSYPVPNLSGVSLREARLQLESNQLQIGAILYVSSDEIPQTAVIDQSPVAGTLLARGASVDLRISNGPLSSPKRVPDLKQIPIDSAEDTLRKYEMQLGRIDNRIDNNYPPGTILSQTPAANARVQRNSRINLSVSSRQVKNGGQP